MPYDTLSVYVIGDWWSTVGAAGRLGLSARLVPGYWLVRPSFRIGALFNDVVDALMAGIGIHAGPRGPYRRRRDSDSA